MKFKDAIRYYELTGSDFLSDLELYSKYIQALEFEYVYDDFTEVTEKLTDNLLILWADRNNVDLNQGIEIEDIDIDEDFNPENFLESKYPNQAQLLQMYVKGIPKPLEESTQEIVFEQPNKFQKKAEFQNKTLDLMISIVNSEMNLIQFYEMEIELVIAILSGVSDKREKEMKKQKSQNRRRS